MATVAIVGASSRIGRAIAAALAHDDHRVVPIDPDAADGIAHVPDDVAAFVHASPASPPARVRADAAAAVARGAHHLDVVTDALHARATDETLGSAASAAGVTVLPCVGPDLVPGEALALLAAGAVIDAVELHVSFAVPSPGGPVGSLTPGGRRAWARARDDVGEVLVAGRPTSERIGEARRLAWFPRPVGPSHALGVPGHVPWALSHQRAGVATVRTYLALPSWRAEWVQLAAAVSRWAPARRWLARPLERGGLRDGAALAAVRWACVAEARGRDDEVARAWANGTDPLAGSAAAVAELVASVVAGGAPTGVVSPAAIVDPTDLLDRLAARVGLRWSVVRPGDGAGPREPRTER